ncbi:putative motility protein YjfB-like [Mobilisporobacter senegalensis]|uniref:Putative motility protein YjfB-like n=1 Tax=Mobilisporobacter senegalensis TaxID=1329262 RepID=A0A3N1XV14_9FIRM|nr:YjfB family protein [Mobilisporobacter senegalensis]ROR28747.1 putative motility protein YjfB-like [Mobilisporobacter senegalensis]
MDIGKLSPALSQGQLITEVNIGMLRKNLDTVETLGDAMIQMMEQSVNPNLGQNVDIRL